MDSVVKHYNDDNYALITIRPRSRRNGMCMYLQTGLHFEITALKLVKWCWVKSWWKCLANDKQISTHQKVALDHVFSSMQVFVWVSLYILTFLHHHIHHRPHCHYFDNTDAHNSSALMDIFHFCLSSIILNMLQSFCT